MLPVKRTRNARLTTAIFLARVADPQIQRSMSPHGYMASSWRRLLVPWLLFFVGYTWFIGNRVSLSKRSERNIGESKKRSGTTSCRCENKHELQHSPCPCLGATPIEMLIMGRRNPHVLCCILPPNPPACATISRMTRMPTAWKRHLFLPTRMMISMHETEHGECRLVGVYRA